MKLFIIFFFMFISTGYSQYISDTTFTVDSKNNCVSFVDTLHNDIISASVGIYQYENLLAPDSIYQVTLTGQAYFSTSGNAPMTGIMVCYRTDSSIDVYNYMSKNDTLFFKVPTTYTQFNYFNAFLIDAGLVYDNIGEFYLNIKKVSDMPLAININNNENSIIEGFELLQNYPNPFNPYTNIKFSIKKSSHVEITIFNSLGQKVNTLISEKKYPGNYEIVWNGKNNNNTIQPSGNYYYKISVDGKIKTKKMILLK